MRYFTHHPKCKLFITSGAVGLFTLGCGAKQKDHRTPFVAVTPAPPPPKPDPVVEVPLTMDQETFDRWLLKANNTLRLGMSLEDITDADHFVATKPREAALRLMDDPYFYDMMADFTMFWFGTKNGPIWEQYSSHEPARIRYDAAGQLSVVSAIQALKSGGDYFGALFSLAGPGVINTYDDVREDSSKPQEPNKPPRPNAEIRAEILAVVDSQLLNAITALDQGDTIKACDLIDQDHGISEQLDHLGGPSTWQNWQSDLIFGFEISCAFGTDLGGIAMEGTLRHLREILPKVIAKINAYEMQNPKFSDPREVPHVANLPLFAMDDLGIYTSQYNENFFRLLPNSSTNRNRRRASWVLRRFFCDDLTPINVEAPANHAAGEHASNPTCYSCHYKLDPMAGYFREQGFFGMSFADAKNIFFDDNAIASRDVYEKPWRAAPESHREWNIGYVRSTANDSENSWGSNFSDLMTLLRTAPEVRECFVRRVFEYVVDDKQSFDRGWLAQVSERMKETAKTNSTQAIKDVFADILVSKSFLAQDRNSNICYDLPSGVSDAGRPPCRIAGLVEKNCASCHSKTNRQGGLDLTSWISLGNNNFGFPHTTADGVVPRAETFKRMIDRLNTSDNARRMPLAKSMPAAEREELFLWLQHVKQ